MMDSTTQRVYEFHVAFGIKQAVRPVTIKPGPIVKDWLGTYASILESVAESAHTQAASTKDPLILRTQLMVEELGELVRALANGDQVEALDALCDMRYVADGTALTLGLGEIFPAAFEEVHASNMSKLDENGKPIINPAGRVVKSPGFWRPNLKALLDKETRS